MWLTVAATCRVDGHGVETVAAARVACERGWERVLARRICERCVAQHGLWLLCEEQRVVYASVAQHGLW